MQWKKNRPVIGDRDCQAKYAKYDFRHASRRRSVADQSENKSVADPSRRNFLGVGSTALATAALAGIAAHAQETQDTRKADKDHSASDPGQENQALLAENSSSNMPPPTDHGDIGPVWYSFDLVHKRVQEGGWTHEVNSKVLPTSKDLAGVNMRLTAGSFRELHWHTADEWAMMLDGNARVTVMNPDGTMFIDDVSKGDLWLFPAGFPHSIQGLRPNGCEFLLVFDEGDFSEDGTFLLSETVAHTPRNILAKNFGLDKEAIAKLVRKEELYISRQICLYLSRKTRRPLEGSAWNLLSNTRSRWRLWLPRGKHREARFVLWTRVISPFPTMSPLRSLLSSLARCANCTGIPTPASGSSGWPVEGA
jgi:quercetin dioxygenase-like cupin family protein